MKKTAVTPFNSNEMSTAEQSTIIVIQGGSCDRFLGFQTTFRQRRLVSKIEAKFRTFWPPVKFRSVVGEMSEWILQVRSTIKSLVYFWLGSRGGFRHVQHVRPNRGPHKKGPHKRTGKFFRVKWIKATVMTEKGRQFFRRTNERTTFICQWTEWTMTGYQ